MHRRSCPWRAAAALALALGACGGSAEGPSAPNGGAMASAPAREATTTAGEPAREPAPATSATAGSPEPTSAAPRASAPARRGPLDADAEAEVRRLVAEAREATAAGRHDAALEAFDRALTLAPLQPRVLCEAGFVAHRAGRTELAARRIDTALDVFGSPPAVSDRLRVPLAMCLYNRGLVAVALNDHARAIEAFAASLALRPNGAVEAALAAETAAAAASPSAAAEDDGEGDDDEEEGALLIDRLAGLACDSEGGVVDATSRDDLFRALRSGLRGYDQLEDVESPADATEIAVLHDLTVPGSGREILVLRVTSPGMPLSYEHLVIAARAAEGFVFRTFETGTVDRYYSDVEDRSGLDTSRESWRGQTLVLELVRSARLHTREWYSDEVRTLCTETTEEATTYRDTIACRTDVRWLDCYHVPTEVTATPRTTTTVCGGGAPEIDAAPVPPTARATVRIDASALVVERIEGPAERLGAPLVPGTLAWDDAGALRLGVTMLRTDERDD